MTSQYKEFISEYREWDQLEHASEYVLFKQNIGPSLCIDETSLSCGELYTVVTNRAGHGGKGTLVAMVRGTKSEDVIKVLEMGQSENLVGILFWLIPEYEYNFSAADDADNAVFNLLRNEYLDAEFTDFRVNPKTLWVCL